MSFGFLKEEIISKLQSTSVEEIFEAKINEHPKFKSIFDNNQNVLENIVSFLNDDSKVLIIKGFMGSGKSKMFDIVSEVLAEETLIFRTTFHPATHLDDVLLNLFNRFAFYHNKHLISLPKAVSNIFSEKINTYIKSVNLPMLFVFDSLELQKLSRIQQKDVLDFINYLANFEKVKIIVASRNLDEEDISVPFAKSTTILNSLDFEKFKSLLLSNGIQADDTVVENAFNNTKGHYLYVSIMIGLLNLLNMSLSNFMSEFSKKNLPFSEFIFSKVVALVPEKFLKLLCFLAFIRMGVSESFIIKQNIAVREDLVYLLDKGIISIEDNLIFLKDYLKNELIKSIELDLKAKIHLYLYNLYESQLPKKPNERELIISRATMRKEMEYHKTKYGEFLECPDLKTSQEKKFSYFSYSKSVGYEWDFEKSPIACQMLKMSEPLPFKNFLNEKAERFELPKEDLSLIGAAEKPSQENKANKEYSDEELNEMTIEQVVKVAQLKESKFDYKGAILCYEKALSKEFKEGYDSRKPVIMTKIAICLKKYQQFDRAIEKFNQVYEIYKNNEPKKAPLVLLSIAQIYNESYKFVEAKDAYVKILEKNGAVSPELRIRVYLDLAEIEDNNSNPQKAHEYIDKALSESSKITDKKILSEIYFKQALLADDVGKVELAMSYYLKSVVISNDARVNRFLASAYSNLASIYLEKKNTQEAIKYYNLSIQADEELYNYEGLFFSYSNLAELYDNQQTKKIECLRKALSSAEKLDDKFYAYSTAMKVADIYNFQKDYENALKVYVKAKDIAIMLQNQKGITKVQDKINNIQTKIGGDDFRRILQECKDQ